jgi:hypothetical protein
MLPLLNINKTSFENKMSKPTNTKESQVNIIHDYKQKNNHGEK